MAHAMETDPVCGMQVEPAQAEAKGLTAEHDGRTYWFCGRGCMLDFKEDPQRYLAADYTPSM
jgi:Cu+-exporting ATPase